MDDPIPHAPPPWTLKGDIYILPFWTPRTTTAPPNLIYSPLEASSAFAHSQPVGGLAAVQITRYHDTPVGPFDELVLVPGSFESTRDDAAGRRSVSRNPRATRVYVSQRDACYNSRVNWNTPCHLARFSWISNPLTGALTVQVFPEDAPDPAPFLAATFKTTPLLPAFPFALDWIARLGVATRLVQPPLPPGPEPEAEVPATQGWKAVAPHQWSRRCSVGWFDMAQAREPGDGREDFFWPGFGRWRFGVLMKDAEVVIDQPEVWEGPASNE